MDALNIPEITLFFWGICCATRCSLALQTGFFRVAFSEKVHSTARQIFLSDIIALVDVKIKSFRRFFALHFSFKLFILTPFSEEIETIFLKIVVFHFIFTTFSTFFLKNIFLFSPSVSRLIFRSFSRYFYYYVLSTGFMDILFP